MVCLQCSQWKRVNLSLLDVQYLSHLRHSLQPISYFCFLGVHIKVQERQFHLTLAYNFDLAKTAELESLAAKLNLDAPVRWELNVYSRDPRFNGKQVGRLYTRRIVWFGWGVLCDRAYCVIGRILVERVMRNM